MFVLHGRCAHTHIYQVSYTNQYGFTVATSHYGPVSVEIRKREIQRETLVTGWQPDVVTVTEVGN